MRHVLLAVDETEGSRRAAEFVERFFGGTDVTISAVNVARAPITWGPQGPYGWVPPAPYGGVYGWPWAATPGGSAAVDDAVTRRVGDAEAVAAAQAPPGARVDVAFGDPAEAIAIAAETHDADVIVVGSNDKNLLQRLFGRSVSEDLVRDAPRPVLVVG